MPNNLDVNLNNIMFKKINSNNSASAITPSLKVAGIAAVALALLVSQSAFAAITSQLDLGDSGPDVTQLQTYLTANPILYPSGMITGYFGGLTQGGVQKFQISEGIVSQGTPASTGFGRVGPSTMNALNMRMGGGASNAAAAPLILAVNVNPSTTGAAVSWTASEASAGKVYYSKTPITFTNSFDATGVFSGEPIVSGTLADSDGIARTSHTVNISGLDRSTTYYYLVVIYDAAKHVSITTPASFHTD
jgi:peptidoglycan hydrolase-like protein with peptidoglycan-binding domain